MERSKRLAEDRQGGKGREDEAEWPEGANCKSGEAGGGQYGVNVRQRSKADD